MAEIVEGDHPNLVAHWIQQLTLVPAFAAQAELPLPALSGEAASIINMMVDALRGRVGRAGWFSGAAAHAAGVAHAWVRMQQAIPAAVVVQEYRILQRELWQAIRPALILQGPTLADAVTIQEYSRQTRTVGMWRGRGRRRAMSPPPVRRNSSRLPPPL